MIGIYKITNKINGKIYIGQSNNIKRRISEHQYKGDSSRVLIDHVIKKYGWDNFTYEVVEECDSSKLNERETYWIQFYHSNETGYNMNLGGDFQSQGENNGRAILTEEEVREIRTAYANHQRRKEVYKKYADKISFDTFASVWDGTTWSHVMPEVYTEENLLYYSRQATNGENSYTAILSDNEVREIRRRYVTETAKQIYEDYKDRLSYQTLQQILWGRHYKHLPIYSKKKKQWINP